MLSKHAVLVREMPLTVILDKRWIGSYYFLHLIDQELREEEAGEQAAH